VPGVASIGAPQRGPAQGRHVVVLAGGDPLHTPLPRSLPPAAMVIAADSGLALAPSLGLQVDLVVGDLDSVDQEDLADAMAAGTRVERHPADKDRTDLQLALDAAVAAGATCLTVVGAAGGRLDHLLSAMALLADDAYAGCAITALVADAIVTVVRDEVELTGRPGELLSLLPYHGVARGVTTDGLRFPLRDEDLAAGSSRGVSNEFAAPTAHVRLRDGVLLAVQPGELAPPPDGD
jgi:thiamine pyrophosphokinase